MPVNIKTTFSGQKSGKAPLSVDTVPQTTDLPITPGAGPSAPLLRPEFIRLPHPGQQCVRTGLSRSAINALILPSAANEFKPPVRSFVLRQRGAKTGIRLIDYESLTSYIRAHEEANGNQTGGAA